MVYRDRKGPLPKQWRVNGTTAQTVEGEQDKNMQQAGSRTPKQIMTANAIVRGWPHAAWEIAHVRECSSGWAMGGPWLSSGGKDFGLQITVLCSGLTISDNNIVIAQFNHS